MKAKTSKLVSRTALIKDLQHVLKVFPARSRIATFIAFTDAFLTSHGRRTLRGSRTSRQRLNRG